MIKNLGLANAALMACILTGCQGSREDSRGWEGTIDTLSDGRIVVENGEEGLWGDSTFWDVAEDLRIGSVDSEGPDNFGMIVSYAVDDLGRFWVLDQHAAEVRVFDSNGTYVRTVGRRGQGPGEFSQPARIDVGPMARIWVMDPQNNRLSRFDSAGAYIDGLPVPGGFMILPWPGGFDGGAHYYGPLVSFDPEFQIALGKYDLALNPLDTIPLPTDPVERGTFTISSEGRTRVAAGIPFQGGLIWRLSDSGNVWALITDQYRLSEFAPSGDTLRSITKVHELIPVSAEERAEALDELSWFTEQGGKVDPSRIPDSKPPVSSFFLDEDGSIWVARDAGRDESNQTYDVFNAKGQFLGHVLVPFRLQRSPTPIIRDGMLFGIVRDDTDVQYVVRARIEKREKNRD